MSNGAYPCASSATQSKDAFGPSTPHPYCKSASYRLITLSIPFHSIPSIPRSLDAGVLVKIRSFQTCVKFTPKSSSPHDQSSIAILFLSLWYFNQKLPSCIFKVQRQGLDIFGNNAALQLPTERYDCPSCHQSLPSIRYAPHLEKCLGMGRTAARASSRRLEAGRGVQKFSPISHNSFVILRNAALSQDRKSSSPGLGAVGDESDSDSSSSKSTCS